MTSIGQTLAAAREQSGHTLAEISDRTRIRRTVLAAMERDDFAPCGGDFYARGHIRAVCRELGINPAPLITWFIERDAEGPPIPAAPAPRSPEPEPGHSEASATAERTVGSHEFAEAFQDGGTATHDRDDGCCHDHLGDRHGDDRAGSHRAGNAGSHAAAPERPRVRRRRVWPLFFVAFLVLAGVIAGVQAWPDQGFDWSTSPLPVVKDTGRPTPEPTPAQEPEAESAEGRDAKALPGARDAQRSQEDNNGDVRVRLHAHDRMWIRVTDADGGDVFTGVLTDGSQKDWSHSEELRMYLGNAGAVQVEVNGERLGTPGPSGETATLVFDSEGMRSR